MQVLALPGCTPLPPVGLADLLRKCVMLAAELPGPRPPAVELAILSAGDGPLLRAAGGLELRCDGTVREATPGAVVVAPALEPDIQRHLAENQAAIDYLRRAYAAGADVASVCTGAFLLAEAGLLDGRSAATHWAFQELFQARYPRVRLAPQAVVVDTGRVLTTGGAMSFLHLTMLLAERLLGPEVARAASRMFLIDVNKPPQGAYAVFSTQKVHSDEAIRRAQAAIEEAPGAEHALPDLAREAAMSLRTFARRFRLATGNAPREYIQRVRIEAAKRALEDGRESVQEIAEHVGYEDAVAFRKRFIQVTGLTPSEYRARYGARAAPAWVLPARRRSA